MQVGRSIVMREMMGTKIMGSMIKGKRNKMIMTTTMIGVVGTVVSLGAAYMMRKNKNMNNNM